MYKEKLRELLKEAPEVKEQMEKLEFGCIFKRGNNYAKTVGFFGNEYSMVNIDKNNFGYLSFNVHKDDLGEMIGLPLQERFIRMYCENKGIPLTIQNNFLYIFGRKIGKIDNTKDLENQSEYFYKELYTALLELNGN